MADLETQIRSLAERRFEATEAVTFTADAKQRPQQARPTTTNAQTINGTETINMKTNEIAEPPRRMYALGAAASVVAIVVVGIALIARDTDPAPPAATAATVPVTLPPVGSVQVALTGADQNAEATEEFEVVVDAYEAFNRGDAVGWATARNAPDPPPPNLGDPEAQYVAAAHAAGAEYEVLSCNYDGIEDGSVTGHRYTCQTKMIDAFTTAAGLDFDEEFDWTVADGRVVDAVSSFDDLTILRTFMGDLGAWIRDERPGTAFTRIEFYNYPLAAEVPGVLDATDEFVETSDEYPLTDG